VLRGRTEAADEATEVDTVEGAATGSGSRGDDSADEATEADTVEGAATGSDSGGDGSADEAAVDTDRGCRGALLGGHGGGCGGCGGCGGGGGGGDSCCC
jgi:hypothetical protein